MLSGSPDILIEGRPAARVGDPLACFGPPDLLATGAHTVYADGLPLARAGDLTVHGGVIAAGAATTLVGDAGGGGDGARFAATAPAITATGQRAVFTGSGYALRGLDSPQARALRAAAAAGTPLCAVCAGAEDPTQVG